MGARHAARSTLFPACRLTLRREKGTLSDEVASGRFSSWRPLILAAAVGGCLALGPTLSSAAGPTPQQIKAAADEFDRGVKSAQAGNMDEAASHFEAADREAPSPDALKAAIRARRDAKQPARAATLAALALTRYPADKALSDFARSVLTQAGPTLHKVAVACKPECLLVVDNKLVPAEASTEIALYLDPGKHTVSAGWNDKNQSRDVTATAGGSSSLSFSPPPAEKPAASASATAREAPTESATEASPPPPAPGGKLSPVFTYVGIGLTVALGGATVWSGLDTQSNPGPDKVKERCVGLGESCPEYKDGLSRQRRTNILLAATGGTAIVTGLVAALLTNWKGDAGPPPTTGARRGLNLVPGVSFESGGAQFQAAGRF